MEPFLIVFPEENGFWMRQRRPFHAQHLWSELRSPGDHWVVLKGAYVTLAMDQHDPQKWMDMDSISAGIGVQMGVPRMA